MKAEYTNLFKFSVNKDSEEAHVVFEQAVPVLLRDQENTHVVKVSETAITEVSALTMSFSFAKNLAESLREAIEAAEKGE